MQQTLYTIYWLERLDVTMEFKPCYTIALELNDALLTIEQLRKLKLNELKDRIKAITMCCENIDSVGQSGVDSISDGFCPDGVQYDWTKRR